MPAQFLSALFPLFRFPALFCLLSTFCSLRRMFDIPCTETRYAGFLIQGRSLGIGYAKTCSARLLNCRDCSAPAAALNGCLLCLQCLTVVFSVPVHEKAHAFFKWRCWFEANVAYQIVHISIGCQHISGLHRHQAFCAIIPKQFSSTSMKRRSPTGLLLPMS